MSTIKKRWIELISIAKKYPNKPWTLETWQHTFILELNNKCFTLTRRQVSYIFRVLEKQDKAQIIPLKRGIKLYSYIGD